MREMHGIHLDGGANSCVSGVQAAMAIAPMQPWGDVGVRRVLRSQFLEIWHAIQGNYRYGGSKYLPLITEKWGLIKRLVQGEDILANPSFVEIHLTEPCQLKCVWCRGGLREIPKNQAVLDPEYTLSLIDSIALMNAKTFIRFSGLIGEPLLNPQAIQILKDANTHGLHWGLTTNGLLLNKPGLIDELLLAEYVHVSLDVGSDAMYQKLKKGQPGDFERVLSNIESLSRARAEAMSKVQIIVSFLLQSGNFHELPSLSKRLKEIGVNSLEIKMQHFDARLVMGPNEVKEAYRLIDKVKESDECREYSVVKVQDEQEALTKIQRGVMQVGFQRCYANLLGLNTTIDPRGNVQTCCQYYQPILSIQGHIKDEFSNVWNSEQRRKTLEQDPREHCINCSPSDDFVNRFVEFVRGAYEQDASFLMWADQIILNHTSAGAK